MCYIILRAEPDVMYEVVIVDCPTGTQHKKECNTGYVPETYSMVMTPKLFSRNSSLKKKIGHVPTDM